MMSRAEMNDRYGAPDDQHGSDDAAQVAALTAERDALRADNARLCDERLDERIVMQDVIERQAAEIAALTTERDRLVLSHRATWGYGAPKRNVKKATKKSTRPVASKRSR